MSLPDNQERLIFISYRNRDWPFAHRLQERLEARFGGEVYIDRKISSDDYERELLAKVRACAIFVLVVTVHTFDRARLAQHDDWIRREVSLALALDKPIALVLYEGIRLPPTDELPYDIRGITTRQGVKFYPEYFDQAVAALQQHCASIVPALAWSGSPARRRPSPADTTRERRLEAAMPREVAERSSTEVRVKISRIDSKGLRGELPARLASGDEIKKSDARQTTFPMTFPTDEDGRLLPAILCVAVLSEHYDVDFVSYPDSVCGGDFAEIELLPDLDSRTVVFSLTPTLTAPSVGLSRVMVRVFYGRRLLAEIRLATERVARVEELTYVLGASSLDVRPLGAYGNAGGVSYGAPVATLPPPPMQAPRGAAPPPPMARPPAAPPPAPTARPSAAPPPASWSPPPASWSPPPRDAGRPEPVLGSSVSRSWESHGSSTDDYHSQFAAPKRASTRSRALLIALLLVVVVALAVVVLILVL